MYKHNMKGKIMFKKFYRAMILSRAASAANETLKTLSDRQLDDMGLSRATFVSEIVNSVRKDLDTAENSPSTRQMINQIINPNLAGSV
jgi:uncharacterized protein YjiS (DUF1127 family)